jgi:hypothetical protein
LQTCVSISAVIKTEFLMKKYIAFNIVNKIKFYLKNNGQWEESYDNLKIYLEDEVGNYIDKRKKKLVLKTKYSLLNVELYDSK